MRKVLRVLPANITTATLSKRHNHMTKSDTWLLKQCVTGRCVDVLLLPATDADEKKMVQPGEHFAKLNWRIEILNSVTHLLLRLSEVTLVLYSAHSMYYSKK